MKELTGKGKCYYLPKKANFILGKSYDCSYSIDGIAVKDEDEEIIIFSEINWLWYFKNTDELQNRRTR